MKAFSMADPLKLVLAISWWLFIPMTVSAQMDHTHSAGPTENCTKLSSELQAIVSEMNGPGLGIEALPSPGSTPAVEPGIHKLEVALRALAEVWLVAKESESRKTPGAEGTMPNMIKPSENVDSLFGGFVPLTVPKDGMYRISADTTIWIEMIDGEKPIERVKIAPRLHCGRIHKSLGFPLKRERPYWLEMSGSKSSHVTVLITEEPEG